MTMLLLAEPPLAPAPRPVARHVRIASLAARQAVDAMRRAQQERAGT